MTETPEHHRLSEDAARTANWKRWGTYLSERQWGTVREDYSPDGSCWDYFPHEHSRSRAYRWGEDGLLGISDRECRLCFSWAFWNGRDRILKERLFGLNGPEGNHGEDVKELYYYLDATPTHSYSKALYKYPQNEFPYQRLIDEGRDRGRDKDEFEITDTGLFDHNQYFDISAEYCKNSPNDILIKLTVKNCADKPAMLTALPTLWFRNTWAWGRKGKEGYTSKPTIAALNCEQLITEHETLEKFVLNIDPEISGLHKEPIFTENETNIAKLFKSQMAHNFVKDSFHEYIINNRTDVINPELHGTKAAFVVSMMLEANETKVIRLRLSATKELPGTPFGDDFDKIFSERSKEADLFYQTLYPPNIPHQEQQVFRQAYAGLLWSKQFYHYSVREWIEGDPTQPAPDRKSARNTDWQSLYNRDIISMPDKWEYPWYAAWDLAFHMVPFSKIDPNFAKDQLLLFLREWYMHPNGQIPAYEFAFSDVNPPVHAWAVWRVYKITGKKGERDRTFLKRAFQKLLLNFTWWVNRKDVSGRNLFSGGFLGLDNIGVFDRSQPLPTGGYLEQADGTAWMAFFCGTMLSIALELASEDPSYEDMASKFFEHFIAITDAMNHFGGTGLWNQEDGFYYDQLQLPSKAVHLKVRSLVGIIPLLAVEVLEDSIIQRLPGFTKRMSWFISQREDLARHISYMTHREVDGKTLSLLAIPNEDKLRQILRYILDEDEFFSPYGVRSLSKVHEKHPYVFRTEKQEYRVAYVPGESTTAMFGGNSNWRGPVWFPINYLIIEALERYHHFYGDDFKVECPTGSGNMMNLKEVSREMARRMSAIFLPDQNGKRPCHGDCNLYLNSPEWQELILFHEYFHGDSGKGLGASHQTGWTALVTRCLERLAW